MKLKVKVEGGETTRQVVVYRRSCLASSLPTPVPSIA